jgi:hypothetical protein
MLFELIRKIRLRIKLLGYPKPKHIQHDYPSICTICKQKRSSLSNYVADGKVLRICLMCKPYAERRAYKRV